MRIVHGDGDGDGEAASAGQSLLPTAGLVRLSAFLLLAEVGTLAPYVARNSSGMSGLHCRDITGRPRSEFSS